MLSKTLILFFFMRRLQDGEVFELPILAQMQINESMIEFQEHLKSMNKYIVQQVRQGASPALPSTVSD